MLDGAGTLFLLLAAGVGVALFFAAREFVRGVRLAKQEHDARQAAGAGSNYQNDPGDEGKPPPREEAPDRPWHEVLEVTPTTGPEEIKAAYRRMIALYHPDRVNDLGVELRVVAERRAKEINVAYAIARKMRGF